ncbi:MAG: DUF7000 family protein [Nonlabens sp.]|uniref:DUF7000 family protein n=1 Tax=Nonlabens sp. TaxID=1888209 RepID=UPI003EF49363
MKDLNSYVSIYKKQLQQGDVLIAYNGLVKFVMELRTEFIKNHSDEYSFGGILNGYMDYTYFYYSNDFLKSNKLKFGLVLNHLDMRFELWLLGNTKPIQKKYWELMKSTQWNTNRKQMPQYAILETILIQNCDFNNLGFLSDQIESKLFKSSTEIIHYLKKLN